MRYRSLIFFSVFITLTLVSSLAGCASPGTVTVTSTPGTSSPPATTTTPVTAAMTTTTTTGPMTTTTTTTTTTSPPSLPPPATTTSPAAFEVGTLKIKPLTAKIRDTIDISVSVTNTGGTTGSYWVTLKVNGFDVDSQEVTLAAGASETVAFKTSSETQGFFTVDVNGLTGSFTIEAPPALPSTPPPETQTTTPTTTVVAPTTPAEHSEWTIPAGNELPMRAVHMGGNWGSTRDAVSEMPEEYFEYLRDINVNWVGISVALHIEDAMDSTVELDYDESLLSPTFSDEKIRDIISTFRDHGFNVYIHIAIESGAEGEHPVYRWQLGDPNAHTYSDNLDAEFWPWRTDHPQHESFVAEFWQSYTDAVVHIAGLAEEEGAAMLTLGTETDGLFRSRSGGEWPNDFLAEMQAMVSAVRTVYTGQLGYEMHYGAVIENKVGSIHLTKDLGLDFIGLSTYFPLMEEAPQTPPSVDYFEAVWDSIFNTYLIPLQRENDNKPIVCTEFGYVDSPNAVLQADMDSFFPKEFKDRDGNGLDDGEEVQANAYEAFFNTMERYPGVVNGAFLWGVMMATDLVYENGFGQMRTFNIRGKLSEDVVRERYAEWRDS